MGEGDEGAVRLRALLERVVDEVEDPWFAEMYEGFNDGCIFCKSQEQRGPRYIHEPNCVWFDVNAAVGREVDPRHQRRAPSDRTESDGPT